MIRLLKLLIVCFVLSLCIVPRASATYTTTNVTGNVQSILGVPTTGNAFVRIRLRNFSGYVPRVSGIGVINVASVDVVPDGSGNIATQVWGNDIITPGPNITYYTFEFWQNGKALASEDFFIPCTPVSNTCTASTFNFITATPVSNPPTVPAFNAVLQNPLGGQNIVQPNGTSLLLNGAPIVSFVGSSVVGKCIVDAGNFQVQDSVGGCGGGSGTPAGSQYDLQVYLSGSFGSGVTNQANVGVLGNVAVKNFSSDQIRYAGPSGNDSNDGRSWGTAKATIDAAICSLPGGTCSTVNSIGFGTVYVMDGTPACAADGSYGIMIMNSGDPGFSSPPTCWMTNTLNAAESLKVIGIGGFPGGPNSHTTRARIPQNHGADAQHNRPTLWVSGGGALEFDNLATNDQPGRGMVIGECSNGNRTGTCAVAGITLDGDSFGAHDVSGSGPGCDITGASFWIFISDFGCSGTYDTNNSSPNVGASMLIDGQGNTGNGLIFIKNLNMSNGGIRFYQGINGGGLQANYVTMEAPGFMIPCPPTIELVTGSAFTVFDFDNISSADCSGNAPAVQNDEAPTGAVRVMSSQGLGAANVAGPAILEGNYPNTDLNTVTQPLAASQAGFFSGYMLGQSDLTSRMGAPVGIRFANQAPTNPASWYIACYFGGCSTTTGVSDPFGGTNAATISTTNAGGTDNIYFNGNLPSHTFSTGDIIIEKVAVQSGHSGGGFPGAATFDLAITMQPQTSGTVAQISAQGGQSVGSGEWQYHTNIYKVTAGDTFFTGYGANFAQGYPMTYAYPTVVIIPASAGWSFNEVMEYANALTLYNSSCPNGAICDVYGNQLNSSAITAVGSLKLFSGTAFTGSFTHANTANQVYTLPNVTGSVYIHNAASTAVTTNTGIGSSGSPVTLIASTPANQIYPVFGYVVQNRAGVGCTGSESVVVNLVWPGPIGGGQVIQTVASMNISGNGTVDNYQIFSNNTPYVLSGKVIGYYTNIASPLTGCSTQPQYQVFFDYMQ